MRNCISFWFARLRHLTNFIGWCTLLGFLSLCLFFCCCQVLHHLSTPLFPLLYSPLSFFTYIPLSISLSLVSTCSWGARLFWHFQRLFRHFCCGFCWFCRLVELLKIDKIGSGSVICGYSSVITRKLRVNYVRCWETELIGLSVKR